MIDGKIENIQTDNGSEFQKYFEQGCLKLKLNKYYSRNRTPKDNSINERFNRTLQDEFVNLGNSTTDVVQFNQSVTYVPVKYN